MSEYHLDLRDRRILHELDKNARSSFSAIGKTTGIAKETVRYRIEQLTRAGIIQRQLAIVDGARLGYSLYQMLLKLQNVDAKKRVSIVAWLCERPSVRWVANLEGNFDIGIIVAARNALEFHQFFDELQQFSAHIMRKVVSINIHGEFLPRDYLLGRERQHDPAGARTARSYNAHTEPLVLDRTDSLICTLLAEDARRSAVEIAQAVCLSADAVLRRLNRLQHDVIKGYTIILQQQRIGQLQYKLLLTLNARAPRADGLLGFLRMQPRVVAIVHSLAEWDYEVDFEVESVPQLQSIIMEVTNRFADAVRDYQILRVIDMPKYSFYAAPTIDVQDAPANITSRSASGARRRTT